MDARRTAHALAIAGTAFNALRVTRTGALSHWKGLAYPNTAFGATHAAFLAARGITGPLEVFEGNKGFMDAIAGRFEIDWSKEDLERVTQTILKKYNAEIHSQSAIEGLLELRTEHALDHNDVDRIELDIFDVAYHIIGGGEEGKKTNIYTKEEADHSLPYMLAVALLDGQVMPEQYTRERIDRDDVRNLIKRIDVRPRAEFSSRFPNEMPCSLTVMLRDGRRLSKEKQDYEGFRSRPMSWQAVTHKFEQLSANWVAPDRQLQIIDTVRDLEKVHVAALTRLLIDVCTPATQTA
jgi:2-methylcitrate dehydratase